MSIINTKVHMGFLTNNAGDDIPGSTIKWTLKTFYKYFDSCIVIDGKLTDSALEFYKTIPNIKVINSPWTGRHIDQYIVRNNQVPIGDWLLMLDCDEAPTVELAENILHIIKFLEDNNIFIASPPSYNMWCKNNSEEFYKTTWFDPNNPPHGGKRLLYKNNDKLVFIGNFTGTHVTPHIPDCRIAALPYGHYHFKSPETTIFNSAVCIMEDLKPLGEAPNGGIRGLTLEEVNTLENLGKKYNLLNNKNFRKAVKSKALPKEFTDYIKRFKHRSGHCRMLYTLYFTILKAEEDIDPLNYEDACNIGSLNDNYKVSLLRDEPIIVPHTSVLIEDPELPCGAG